MRNVVGIPFSDSKQSAYAARPDGSPFVCHLTHCSEASAEREPEKSTSCTRVGCHRLERIM
jgi:hypothetical protein